MSKRNEITNHRDLFAWRRAMDLAAATYRLSRRFPPSERFGMIQEIRKASVNVAASIADSFDRQESGEFLHFLQDARASVYEVETIAEVAYLTDIVEKDEIQDVLTLADETNRLIVGLGRKWSTHRGGE